MTDVSYKPTMDQLPFDFRERVAALWKCCENGADGYREGCLDALVADCEWTMKSKKERIDFVIGEENGEWSYRFTNPDRIDEANEYLSMDELKKNPNWKQIRIEKIEVTDNAKFVRDNDNSFNSLRSLEEIESLMKFVVFLSNEPHLFLYTMKANDFDSPEGVILLNSISKMTFSQIWASYGFSVYNEILENQFSRRKPTDIVLNNFAGNKEFFIENLVNGNIKKFDGPYSLSFLSAVMERIINGFLDNPDNYVHFFLSSDFEESTKRMLERKLHEGRCVKEEDGSYHFKAYNRRLESDQCFHIGGDTRWRMIANEVSDCQFTS